MNEAVKAYRHVASSPEFRTVERMRSKARRDEAQALYNAERRGEARANEKWQTILVSHPAKKRSGFAVFLPQSCVTSS